MSTKVYGSSDDLIEFEGDVSGEVGCFGTDDEGRDGVLLVFSDGTILEAKYGKLGLGVWAIRLFQKGRDSLLDRIDLCTDEDANPHSDVAHFRDGLKYCHAAKEWERVS